MQLKNWVSTKGRFLVTVSIFTFSLLIFGESCKKKSSLNREEKGTLPKDFVAFYDKFHKDSAYQVAHITFPLEGFPTQADSSVFDNGGYRWQKENWQMHRLENFSDSLFVRQFDSPTEGYVVELVKQKNTPFGIMRRFFKRGDEWFLIFYSDMNTIQE
jgi:hypothetical protein